MTDTALKFFFLAVIIIAASVTISIGFKLYRNSESVSKSYIEDANNTAGKMQQSKYSKYATGNELIGEDVVLAIEKYQSKFKITVEYYDGHTVTFPISDSYELSNDNTASPNYIAPNRYFESTMLTDVNGLISGFTFTQTDRVKE